MHLSPRHLLSASLRVAAVFLSARLAVHSDLLASPFLFGSHLFFVYPLARLGQSDVPSQLEHSSNSFVAHDIWLESATVPDPQRQDHVSHPRCCDNGLSIAVAAQSIQLTRAKAHQIALRRPSLAILQPARPIVELLLPIV